MLEYPWTLGHLHGSKYFQQPQQKPEMTSVFTGLNDLSKKSYITTEAPNGHIYSYTKSYNAGTYTWSGVLNPISFGSSPYNVPGIVMRETGKKLYKDANPGVEKYMVGVFIVDQDGENVSADLGQMFIDPNCSVFAQFNGQRPTYIPTATDEEVGGLDFGNPVYTRGNITTTNGNIAATSTVNGTGSLLLGPSASTTGYNNVVALGAAATADNQVITAGPIAAGTSVTVGTRLLLPTGDAGIVGSASLTNGSVTVNTTAVQSGSFIFLTNRTFEDTAGILRISAINPGVSFTVSSTSGSDDSDFNWLIIN